MGKNSGDLVLSRGFFKVKIKRRAVRALERIHRGYRIRVLETLDVLKINPVPLRDYDLKKLRGYEDTFRIRIGNIRIVYTVDWVSRTIIVHFIGYRESAYKQLYEDN